MDIHQVRKIYGMLAVVALFMVGGAPMIGRMTSKTVFWYMICGGIAMALLAVFYAWKKYRCPYCGEILRAREPMPDFCPNCGARLK